MDSEFAEKCCHFETEPGYPTEADAAAAFDAICDSTGLFKTYREVPGWYFNRPMFCDERDPKIDRILMPLQGLIAAGWRNGAIGVELKRSHTKLKDVLNQAEDYRNALFRLPESGHVIGLPQVFIWPFKRAHGAIESSMAQKRIGGASELGGSLCFQLGATFVLRVTRDGRIHLGRESMGRKLGHR